MKNIQKRLRAFVASAMMLCAILPSFAYSFEADGIYYNITGEAEIEVTSGSIEYSGDVVIPSSVSCSGTTYSVTAIGKEAFRFCYGLTSVTIPNSVTSIGNSAFTYCSGLTSVTIPNSVTEIGSDAFYGCTSLTSVTIPNSVTSIADGAFADCSGLTSVTIPNSVTTIGQGAFQRCTGLTSVNIPNSVTEIGRTAFSGCTGLTSVTIPNSVTEIGNCAFECCTSLTSVTIGNSVTEIGWSAFAGCTGLTNVTIPNSVTRIGNYAFYGCSGLTSVTSLADVPPTCDSDVFLNVDTENCPLYVPIGSKDAYSNADTWKDFRNIVELSAGIDDIVSDQGNKPTEYYNLNGVRVDNPHNGIYIKRQGSKAEKVLIK